MQSLSGPPLKTRFLLELAPRNGSGINFPWEQYQEALYQFVIGNAVFSVTQANLPAPAKNQSGLVVNISDYQHTLQWNGTAWMWGPGDSGSGWVALFPLGAPSGPGWHLCDGSTVNKLNADGTISSVVLPTTALTYFRQ